MAELDALKAKFRRIPYIDPIDIRYRRFETMPKPVAQAVMFCLMDVSGSMSEHMKDLAKRFHMLPYLFLTRRYRHVEISSSFVIPTGRKYSRAIISNRVGHALKNCTTGTTTKVLTGWDCGFFLGPAIAQAPSTATRGRTCTKF